MWHWRSACWMPRSALNTFWKLTSAATPSVLGVLLAHDINKFCMKFSVAHCTQRTRLASSGRHWLHHHSSCASLWYIQVLLGLYAPQPPAQSGYLHALHIYPPSSKLDSKTAMCWFAKQMLHGEYWHSWRLQRCSVLHPMSHWRKRTGENADCVFSCTHFRHSTWARPLLRQQLLVLSSLRSGSLSTDVAERITALSAPPISNTVMWH